MAYDAAAAAAARREERGEPFTFLWGGETFRIDAPDEWPGRATDLLSERKGYSALMEILDGTEQGQAGRIRRLAPLRNADVNGILDALSSHLGVGDTAGE